MPRADPYSGEAASDRAASRLTPYQEFFLALGVYSAVTVWFTWPLVAQISRSVLITFRFAREDVYAYLWILSWVARALSHDPATLFDGNVLHPAPEIIAASEHMLANQLVFGPIWLMTGNPVLAFNCTILASFVVCALAMHLLVRKWTGSVGAAFVAALAFSFAAYRLDFVSRMHLLQIPYFPLMLLLLDRVVRVGGIRNALLAGLVIALQVLSSYYLGYIACFVVAAYFVGHLALFGFSKLRTSWPAVTLAVASPAIVVVPLSIPYLRAAAQGRLLFEPDLTLSAIPALLPLFYFAGGWVTILLALVGAARLLSWSSDRERSARILGLILAVGVGWILAQGGAGFGPGYPSPYLWLAELIPGLDRMRVPFRFGLAAGFALCALAGYGVALALERVVRLSGSLFSRGVVTSVACVSVLAPAAYLPTPDRMQLAPPADLSAAYGWLSENAERGALLELPIGPMLGGLRNAAAGSAMYASTGHWLPVLNGWTSYMPRSYEIVEGYAEQLPNADALQLLVDCTDLRWILVRHKGARAEAWQNLAGVRRVASFALASGGEEAIYEVQLSPRPGCAERLFQAEHTLSGTRAELLRTLEGELVVRGLPPRTRPGRAIRVELEVSNLGDAPWPATAVDPELRVEVIADWSLADGGSSQARQRVLLPADLAPAEARQFSVWLQSPGEPGPYRVTLRLSQAGRSELKPVEWSRRVNVVRRSRSVRKGR